MPKIRAIIDVFRKFQFQEWRNPIPRKRKTKKTTGYHFWKITIARMDNVDLEDAERCSRRRSTSIYKCLRCFPERSHVVSFSLLKVIMSFEFVYIYIVFLKVIRRARRFTYCNFIIFVGTMKEVGGIAFYDAIVTIAEKEREWGLITIQHLISIHLRLS